METQFHKKISCKSEGISMCKMIFQNSKLVKFYKYAELVTNISKL